MDSPAEPGETGELVAVVEAADGIEAEMVQGLLERAGIPSALQQVEIDGSGIGFGLLNPKGGARRVLVPVNRLGEAHALLVDTLVEDEEAAWPESVNARYLEEAAGGKRLRRYGVIGAYARIYLWALIAFALAFVFLMITRALS